MEKLEKSVKPAVVTKQSFWKQNGMVLMFSVLVFSVVANYVLFNSYREEWRRHRDFARLWNQDEQTIEQMQQIADRYNRDWAALSPGGKVGYDELGVFQLSTQEWVDVYAACMHNPSPLYIAPETIATDRVINVENPEPIHNYAGVWFGPGDFCKVANGGWLRPASADNGDRYILQVEYQKPDYSRDACPSGAYILALAKNKIVDNAVFRGCVQRTKFMQLGLVH